MPSISVLIRSSIGVEQRAQLVDRRRDRRQPARVVGAAGIDDVAHRGESADDRLERRRVTSDPAGEADQHDDHGHERDDGPESGEQLLTVSVLLPDLEQRAVEELRRRDFEPGARRSRRGLLPRAASSASRLTSKSLHSGGMLTKSVSLPPRTTRTNSRSWRPDRCSRSTARASAARPPVS